MTTKPSEFWKLIINILEMRTAFKEGKDYKKDTFENNIKTNASYLQYIEESEKFFNNKELKKEFLLVKHHLFASLIYNEEDNTWGEIIFQNNKIKIPITNVDEYLVKYFRCLVFRELMGKIFNHYNINTYEIFICLLEGTKYPDLIIIDSSINYQELEWEELQELTDKNNQYGFPLVYLSSVFIAPEYENSLNNLQFLNSAEVFPKIYNNKANHIMLLTKKYIQLYPFNMYETRRLYEMTNDYFKSLKRRNEEEFTNAVIFLLEKSFTTMEIIKISAEGKETYYGYLDKKPDMNRETTIFMDLLVKKEKEEQIEYLKNNYYKINETFQENENYIKKGKEAVKKFAALGIKLQEPEEDITAPELIQGIEKLVEEYKQEIPLLNEKEWKIQQQLLLIYLYELMKETYQEEVLIENIFIDIPYIEVKIKNKIIIIFMKRYSTEQELLYIILVNSKIVFIHEALWIMEKEIIWIKPEEIERLTRCVKIQVKILKRDKNQKECKKEVIREQEEEFYYEIGEKQLEIMGFPRNENK